MNRVVFLLTLSLSSCHLSWAADEYKNGHYYTTDGRKVYGLIVFLRGSFSVFGTSPGIIKYKPNTNTKPVKLNSSDISAFVIERDSFTLITDFKINSIGGVFRKDFVQVLETGALKLYLHRSSSNDGRYHYEHQRLVISVDNKRYFGIWSQQKQREEIARYFEDETVLKEKILDKRDETPLHVLVRAYNWKKRTSQTQHSDHN